jgi:large subunit ribosomal protein L22
MATRAHSHGVGISPRKMRLVIDQVRGKPVDVALARLQFMPSQAAAVVSRTIRSAVANAENNDLMSREDLKIVSVTADEGPTLRRYRPKARGRVGAFNRPSVHLTVVVDEQGD